MTSQGNKSTSIVIATVMLLVAVAGAVWFVGPMLFSPTSVPSTSSEISVDMVVYHPDGRKLDFSGTVVDKDATVYQLMSQIEANEARFDFVQQGSGDMIFVSEIMGLRGESEDPDGRFWLYSLNGESAELGVAQQHLQAGDTVTWRYTQYNAK